ncbi:cyclohexanone monooxygenase [Mycobacterium sp. 1100029.7]|nr:cyclohexanone monooxygenase [Mycobacterium sp. 1100029.7]
MMTDTAVDVVVVGAGFAGLYAVHALRNLHGFSVLGVDAGDDVGGTWHWNGYPGARVDIESFHYCYSFDEQLQQEWQWTERYASQPEIQRYLAHVADRFDLRRSFIFGRRVTSGHWDDESCVWTVGLDDDTQLTAKYLVAGTGYVSVPKPPDIPGLARFAGRVLRTADWREDVDLTGRRIGVVGTGSSGIHVVSECAKVADHLTVFQRTPSYATPLQNAPIDPVSDAERKAHYREIRELSRRCLGGLPYTESEPSAVAASPQRREAVFDDRWRRGGFEFIFNTFDDILFDPRANEAACDYIRDKIRQRVHDPATAALLSPGYPYGGRRPPLESDYYDAFNRDNVQLVDVAANPIAEVEAEGVRLRDGTLHRLDTLILATGFDAFTGGVLGLNLVGRQGLRLKDAWADGARALLGIAIHGFPNFFMLTGPLTPAAFFVHPLAAEHDVDFVAGILVRMRTCGHSAAEAQAAAEQQWVDHHAEVAAATFLGQANSYYTGANIPGKPSQMLAYVGGGPAFHQRCAQEQQDGYPGFTFRPAQTLHQPENPGRRSGRSLSDDVTHANP